MKWSHTVGDILASNWSVVENMDLNSHQLRHLNQLSRCHTASLGGSMHQCQKCHHEKYVYHSCRNRHCPSCTGSKRDQWIETQQSYLLDVPYYHVVFTLPSELNQFCLYKPRVIYDLLFKSSWKTIQTFAKDPKYLNAQTGMTAVLHTWSQNMTLHPHLHCIIPGGGMSKSGKWKTTRSKGKYLFPVQVMAEVYRAIFMKSLKELAALDEITLEPVLREKLYKKRWVVYAKRPFASPHQIIEYLGRYTHKSAISNHRLIETDINKQTVTFKWKDYRHGAIVKPMVLSNREFIRRFALHILPHKFVRVRHYGILSFHGRSKSIPKIQIEQNYTPVHKTIYDLPARVLKCPKCESTDIVTHALLPTKSRSP